MKVFFVLIFFSFSVSANTCRRIVDCVGEVSRLTGVKYLYPENLFQQQTLNQEIVFQKENADVVLSETLNMFGYARIPTKVKDVWKIIPAIDIRYQSDIPAFKASKKTLPELPDNHDFIQLTYTASARADVGSITRNIRPMLSRYGRVLDLRGGVIILIDTASAVRRMLPIIQSQDFPLTKEEKQKMKATKEHNHKHEIAPMNEAAPGMVEQ